jgi:peptidoglycan/xylan/chitin deacetylase (PgdA/CDA1 family)
MALKKIGNKSLNLLFKSGGLELAQGRNRRQLAILNYHRIEHSGGGASAFFRPNFSASATAFDEQMDYICRNYNVISLPQFLAWQSGGDALPDFPVMITFDDGYRDNLTTALPILKKYGMPAVIFLTSGHIGKSNGFYWDISAQCFFRTKKQRANLPYVGEKAWDDEPARQSVCGEWVEALKRISEADKQSAMRALPDILEVDIPPKTFSGVMLSWDEVRGMVSEGIAFGAHTVSHPILTRVSLEDAEREMAESKMQIEKEIGAPVQTFTYPNGQKSDISPALERIAEKVGFQAAFSLMPGPSPLDEVQRNRFNIRRIYIGAADTLPRFAAKLAGVSRLLER